MAARAQRSGPWGRRRLLATLGGITLGALALLVGLGFAVHYALSSVPAPSQASDEDWPGSGAGPTTAAGADPRPGQGAREQIAAAPMMVAAPTDSRPMEPAAVAAPTITIPASTRVGPASVPTGFPQSPEGAVGQLGAMDVTALQQMSIRTANDVYQGWAMPGGAGPGEWEITRSVQAFLGSAQMRDEKDPTTTVVASPVGGQVKGTDGPDWVVVCVLLEVRATITVQARVGYGHCERMQWADDRWMIAPGDPPARAPSTWPGSEAALQAGWRTWVEQDNG